MMAYINQAKPSDTVLLVLKSEQLIANQIENFVIVTIKHTYFQCTIIA